MGAGALPTAASVKSTSLIQGIGAVAKKHWLGAGIFVTTELLQGEGFLESVVKGVGQQILFEMFPSLYVGYGIATVGLSIANGISQSMTASAAAHDAHGYINYHTRTAEAQQNRAIAMSMMNYHRSLGSIGSQYGNEAAMLHRV